MRMGRTHYELPFELPIKPTTCRCSPWLIPSESKEIEAMRSESPNVSWSISWKSTRLKAPVGFIFHREESPRAAARGLEMHQLTICLLLRFKQFIYLRVRQVFLAVVGVDDQGRAAGRDPDQVVAELQYGFDLRMPFQQAEIGIALGLDGERGHL